MAKRELRGFDTFVRFEDSKTPRQVIEAYAKRCGDTPWNPESCIEDAAKRGYAFWDQRSWGRHFAMAAADGIIKPDGMFARKTSNGSKRPGWVRTRD